MKYQQRTFSVTMPGHKVRWPLRRFPGCDNCGERGKLSLTPIDDVHVWLCPRCKNEIEHPTFID